MDSNIDIKHGKYTTKPCVPLVGCIHRRVILQYQRMYCDVRLMDFLKMALVQSHLSVRSMI